MVRCLEEIQRNTWVEPAIHVFRQLFDLYPSDPPPSPTPSSSPSRTRADVWRDINLKTDVKKLAMDSFAQYMAKAKEV